MIRSPVRLTLHNNVQTGGGFLQDATEQLARTWKRTIRDVGGYWLGTARWEGSPAEMLDVFQNGMQWELRESAGGLMTWQGFLAEMSLTYKGQVYTRSWTDLANRVKAIYSRIGPNLITNNSCEATVWDAIGTPATRERSAAWATEGSYSAHVVTDAANEGVTIQTAIAIAAAQEYQAHVTVYVESGTWRLEIIASDGSVIDFAELAGVGQMVLYVGVPPDAYAAQNVALRLYCTDAAGEIYADAAVFQLAPNRAETSWYPNASSAVEYGVIEHILLQAGMTDTAANALARRYLVDHAWARTLPPATISPDEDADKNRLELTFYGYAATLANKYSQQIGADDAASDIVTAILSEAEFVEVGEIQTNALEYHIDDREAVRHWDILREIAQAGDASGNRWTCGVYADRRFFYRRASDQVVARLRGGRLLDPGGGPLQGWFAEPGLVALDDMPLAYAAITGQAADGASRAWMNEVEFSLGKFLDGEGSIAFRQVIA
jgi:hypothetical protein